LFLAFVDDVANGLARYRTFAVVAPHSSFKVTKAGKVAELDALRADYLVRSKVFSDKIITFSLMLRKHNEIIWSMEVSADRLH
ncbi:hypothetical protein ABTL97_19695, partial [Acinetobacter baumannii]